MKTKRIAVHTGTFAMVSFWLRPSPKLVAWIVKKLKLDGVELMPLARWAPDKVLKAFPEEMVVSTCPSFMLPATPFFRLWFEVGEENNTEPELREYFSNCPHVIYDAGDGLVYNNAKEGDAIHTNHGVFTWEDIIMGKLKAGVKIVWDTCHTLVTGGTGATPLAHDGKDFAQKLELLAKMGKLALAHWQPKRLPGSLYKWAIHDFKQTWDFILRPKNSELGKMISPLKNYPNIPVVIEYMPYFGPFTILIVHLLHMATKKALNW